MSSCYFRKPEPIEIRVPIERDDIVGDAVSILNKIAEARFDGQNTKYVNNMQPEVDFEQDKGIVDGLYEEALSNIVRRIEPYVKEYGKESGEVMQHGDFNNDFNNDFFGSHAVAQEHDVLYLIFPENWKRQEQRALESKIRNYLVHFIIANWVEKVSMSDTAYTMEKAAELLRSVKGICELRQGKVHRGWNTTY